MSTMRSLVKGLPHNIQIELERCAVPLKFGYMATRTNRPRTAAGGIVYAPGVYNPDGLFRLFVQAYDGGFLSDEIKAIGCRAGRARVAHGEEIDYLSTQLSVEKLFTRYFWGEIGCFCVCVRTAVGV